MTKKIVIAGLFLGGGILLIRYVLPQFKKTESDFDIEPVIYEPEESIVRYGGGGGGRDVQSTRSELPFDVRTDLGKLNDPTWGFNPYDLNTLSEFKKGANNPVL